MPRKKTRRTLSKETIVAEALKLIEKNGLDGFSMRTLAARLKIEPMSLYHHFRSRMELLNGMLDHVLAEIRFLGRSAQWEDRIRFVAREWRRVALQYPQFFPFCAVHRLDTEYALQLQESILGIFHSAGLSNVEAARYFRIFKFFLLGSGMDEVADISNGPGATETLSADEMDCHFPLLAKAGELVEFDHRNRTFEMGLDHLIHSILGRNSTRTDRQASPHDSSPRLNQ